MVFLTEQEVTILKEKQPLLRYDKEKGLINGTFQLNHHFKDKQTIKETFEIEVRVCAIENRNMWPPVYNTDNKIQRIAERKNIPIIDLHTFENNKLCLGLPIRFKEIYQQGFTIQRFIEHLAEFFYWVAYRERYNEEPWRAEAHGGIANLEYLYEKWEYLFESKDIEEMRKVYKCVLERGIAKSKLQHIVNNPSEYKKLTKTIFMVIWKKIQTFYTNVLKKEGVK